MVSESKINEYIYYIVSGEFLVTRKAMSFKNLQKKINSSDVENKLRKRVVYSVLGEGESFGEESAMAMGDKLS